MTVKELIKKLSKLDPNLIIIKSSDDEGNSYQTIDDISLGNYDAEYREYHEELDDQTVDDEDIKEDDRFIPCVCLW